MNDRLAQDAADALASHEAITAARRERMIAAGRAMLAAKRYPGPRKSTAPALPNIVITITEQELQEREAQIQAGLLPF